MRKGRNIIFPTSESGVNGSPHHNNIGSEISIKNSWKRTIFKIPCLIFLTVKLIVVEIQMVIVIKYTRLSWKMMFSFLSLQDYLGI